MKVNIGAAFVEGFRVIGREPLSLVGWALALVAYYIVQFVVGMVSGGAMAAGMMANMSRIESGQIDPGMFGGMFVMFLIIAAVGLIFFSIVGSAIYRAVLDPSGSRAWARLRLTGVELTFALTLFLLCIIYIVWYLLTVVVCAMLIRMGGLGGVLAFFAGAFSGLSFLSLFAFVGPMTVDKGRFCLGEAVGKAAGEFWRLIGLYLLLFLLLVAFYILLAIVAFAFLGGTLASLSSAGTDPAQAQQAVMGILTSPVTWLLLFVVLPVVGAAVQVIFVTPAARAYVDTVGGPASQQADAFN